MIAMPWGPLYCKLTFVKVMAWRRLSVKPLPEPMITQICVVIVSLGTSELKLQMP